MIASVKDLKEKVLDIKYDRIEQGLGLGINEVDEWLRFKRGAFNICVGHANTGKTTVILYFATVPFVLIIRGTLSSSTFIKIL